MFARHRDGGWQRAASCSTPHAANTAQRANATMTMPRARQYLCIKCVGRCRGSTNAGPDRLLLLRGRCSRR
jgi:hypothetical protein